MGSNDKIKVRVINRDDLRISHIFIVSISEGENNRNREEKEDITKDIEDEENIVCKGDINKDRKWDSLAKVTLEGNNDRSIDRKTYSELIRS